MHELFTLRRTFNSENEIINSKPDNLDWCLNCGWYFWFIS
jgi:hypothetical protein